MYTNQTSFFFLEGGERRVNCSLTRGSTAGSVETARRYYLLMQPTVLHRTTSSNLHRFLFLSCISVITLKTCFFNFSPPHPHSHPPLSVCVCMVLPIIDMHRGYRGGIVLQVRLGARHDVDTTAVCFHEAVLSSRDEEEDAADPRRLSTSTSLCFRTFPSLVANTAKCLCWMSLCPNTAQSVLSQLRVQIQNNQCL